MLGSAVVDEIHSEDLLYRYILDRRGPKEGHTAYFNGGLQDAKQVSAAAKRALKRDDIKVLEFASGFGRVTRHLPTVLPNADIAASDIHPKACEFIRGGLGMKSFTSATDPAKLEAGSDYDFIFVLSLFSHLPHRTFGAWLAALYQRLAPGGALLFTTHGETSRLRFSGIDLSREEQGEGWIYRRASDQPDLDAEEYGTMLVTPRYVADSVEVIKGAILRSFDAGRWMGHQDEWVVQKPA